MNYGVIDIGSNTIRMVICQVSNGQIDIICNEREKSVLLECIEDGYLTQDGMDFLALTLARMSAICDISNCAEIHAFATASLRNIKNADEVISFIKAETQIDVRIITGEEEALYDYEGLKASVNTLDGVALDLGGGSCQILTYSGGNLNSVNSFTIGSFKMHKAFVAGKIPTLEEAKNIYDFVISELSAVDYLKGISFKTLYTMGGTAKNAVQLHNRINNIKTPNLPVSKAELEQIYKHIISKGNSGEEFIKTHFPDRINSLIPGIIVLCAICDYILAEEIKIAVCGVREGYIIKELLK